MMAYTPLHAGLRFLKAGCTLLLSTLLIPTLPSAVTAASYIPHLPRPRPLILPTHYPATGIELLLNSRVLGVQQKSVKVADKSGQETDIPFGACVWSTGIGMHPLIKQLKEAFPAVQTHNRWVAGVNVRGWHEVCADRNLTSDTSCTGVAAASFLICILLIQSACKPGPLHNCMDYISVA
jgi:hypothetical protein